MASRRNEEGSHHYLGVDPRAQLDRYEVIEDPKSKVAARMSSFDHCYSYFQSAFVSRRQSELANDVSIQSSCLHLGFYLASWGMYRASGALSEFSSARLSPVVQVIANAPLQIWDLDVDRYSTDSIKALIDFGERLRAEFPRGKGRAKSKASDTLVTKALLGVFGNTPAFDTYFRSGMGCQSFNEKSLNRVRSYFDKHRDAIEEARDPVCDFDGTPNKFRYTQAKVIDMIFFAKGGGIGIS